MFTSFTGLPALGQRGPLEAHCEKGMQQTEGGVLGMGPLQQSSGGSGGSLPRCSSPYMSRSPAPLWSDRQPGADSMRNPYGSVLHHPEQVSAQTTGPANGSCTQFPPGASIAEFSHWGESCRQPPSLLKGRDSTVRQAVFAEGCNSRSFLPPMKPWQATTPRSTEKAEEFNYDQRAEVVTVYGTDRFWDLMETLAELKAGPTSLLSSSVTFDSVLLPGGELQYSVIEEGSFGKVFVGSHQGTKVAIKVPVDCMLSTDPAGVMERTLNEWRILSVCQHPNVVRLIGGIVHGPFDVWLVTQLVNGSDLHSRKYSRDPLVRRFISPENGLHMCRQLAAVVAYLHTPVPGIKPIVVHRDIKPENVLIADDWTIRLCDFGDAEASADGRVSRVSGATWFYAPAELLRCSPVEFMASNPGRQLPPLNEKWDIWSMGCVFQEMFGFFNPMHVHISSRDSPSVIYEKLKSKAIAGALVPHIAEEIQGVARNIILRCLDPDPSARPSAMEVLKMWSAPDEYILKDIRTRRNHPHANVVETSSLNITKWQRFPGIIPEPLHLLPNVGSPPAETSIQFRSGDNIGNAVRGQLHPAASAGASAGASPGPAGALLLENRERDNWVANASNASAPFPVIPATSLVAKEGARVVQPQGFVQSQGLWPAAGWQ
ncbi:protein kinase, putative [Eimeria praecox]|uniref:Protein kinase, putative n=1 Tax=Eimeria praecox TaxID=51316 RepID=U6G8G9_9EIME|nr:protein kinase, putative [Eimeria praecox]